MASDKEHTPALIEFIARRESERAGNVLKPGDRWNNRAYPEHLREYYRRFARRFIADMGGEAELFAFCEAVLATRATLAVGCSEQEANE